MSEVIYKDAELVWDVQKEHPRLFEQLISSKHKEWLKAWLKESDGRVPTLESCRPFDGKVWRRPLRHARAIYRAIDASTNLCLKGTEAWCADLDIELQESPKRDMHQKYINQIDWWIRIEQKSPFVMTVKEGIEEASIAAQIQTDYHDKFGGFAKLPIPIRVFKFPNSLRDSYLAKLKRVCSPSIEALAEHVVSSGLCAYCYFLEGTYERVTLLGHPYSAEKSGYQGRMRLLKEQFPSLDLEKSMNSWVKLAVDMMSLGWMPANYNTDYTGQMVRYNNATIDGGFVDVDSARRISEIPSDQDFFKSFWYLITELTSCYIVSMVGADKFSTGMWASHTYPSPIYGDAMCAILVWDKFISCIEDSKRSGASFDRRVEMLLDKKHPFAKLDFMLTALFPATALVRPTKNL
jgi:hypothetical protein